MTATAKDSVVDVGFAGLVLGATALFMAVVLLLLKACMDQPREMAGVSMFFGRAISPLLLLPHGRRPGYRAGGSTVRVQARVCLFLQVVLMSTLSLTRLGEALCR